MTFEERKLPPQPDDDLVDDAIAMFHVGVEEQHLHLFDPLEETGGDDGAIVIDVDESVPENEEEVGSPVGEGEGINLNYLELVFLVC